MKYIIDIFPHSSGPDIPYSAELENEIQKTVARWIQENIEYPGYWHTYVWAEDKDGPITPASRVN